MVTYDFYKNVYMGSALSQGVFTEAAARADDWLKMLRRSCTIVPYGEDSYAMAVCAVAETMEIFGKSRNIKQASVGGVSVSYDPDDRRLQRQMLQNAGVYLDICRGVG